MGFATVEEQQGQLRAVIREKEQSEMQLARIKEEFDASKELGDHEQIVFLGRQMRELERNVKACTEQIKAIESSGTTRAGRASRR